MTLRDAVTAALAGLQADGSLAHLGVHQRRLGPPRQVGELN
jgi:hypothetical protein